MPLKWRINVLEELNNKGYTTYRLRRENLLPEGTIQKLRANDPVAWVSIEKICGLLQCQPGDILFMDDIPTE